MTVTAARRPAAGSRGAPLRAVPLWAGAAVLSVLLALLMLVAIGIGSVDVPVADTWHIVTRHLAGRSTDGLDPVQNQIVWEYRMPRVLLAALAGAGLAVAGVVLQALVANPLADPYVLGISSGASTGAVLVMTSGAAAVGGIGVSAAAFAGAAVATAAVFVLGQRAGRLSPLRIVLAGIAIGYLFQAATGYLQLRSNPNELRRVMFWLLGSVAGARWDQLKVVSAVVIVLTLVLTLCGRQLNALVTGEEQATALGIDVNRLRVVLFTASALLTGTVIAVTGGVGFVGLLIPHIVRLGFGPDHRRVLPLAALLGALYLVGVDLLSRTVDAPNEIPLGIFTAAVGAPVLLWLLRRESDAGSGR
ncbi:MAG: iron ABC transporter permease [Streptomycetaceae bacterium]|nr:iron ABC transporter permease [Streptomycetaceae bacterium]